MIQRLFPIYPILIVDDEEHVVLSFDTELRGSGFNNLITRTDSREVLPLLSERPVSVVLLDLWMPHLTGEQLLSELSLEHPDLPVIVVTGIDQVETAVRCMKTGAFDYLVKPVEEGLLAAAVERALMFREMKEEISHLKGCLFADEPRRPEAFAAIVTQSETMLTLFRYVEAIAPGGQPVLVTGETGTGKELIARAVHELSGRSGPFVAVNVAGLDDGVFTDTLFGHRKGAFTGADQPRTGLVEQAAGGVLFLDEIGDLSPTSQVKLLRLVQEKEYRPLGQDQVKRMNARLIVATNQDLKDQVEKGRFRKDLYFRLRTHQVHLPPLRDRQEDLPLLVEFFLEKAARELKKKKPPPPPELFALLRSHHFPGNVRELESLIYDAVSRHQAKVLSLETFRTSINPRTPAGSASHSSPADLDTAALYASCPRLPTLNQAGELLVEEALRRSGGNITQAAESLGITRQALSKRLRRVG
ncbi:MAG: sigma-54 dependent transcriptional regulator [Thermodesulfobacteriota bacterium]